jgi:hypothetical protein
MRGRAERVDRGARIAAVFRAALDLEPEAREPFLAEQCGDDAALAAEVGALLATVDTAPSPLDHDPAGRLGLSPNASSSTPPPRVGPFRLLRLLGRGGMGEVWLAERIDGGFAQHVALKWVDPARLGPDGLERFARERALLARVDHPSIARVVDGGEVDGTPWFAMEYVDGVPIDRHVAEARPDLAATIDLLQPVVEAVQHLHRHLVVHRDLKPSNVLVDREGRPRLIDLGIAKSLGEETQLTGALAPMSVAYAAPEQVAGEAITIATDVYGLGALLHEVLSGRSPHAAAEGSLPRLVDAIARGTPTLPSAALAADPTARSWRAAQLTGDLDLIVATCLKREPERRYASAAALGEDLKRWRERLPIAARRDSAGYRARRFVERHPLGTALGAVAIASLLAATGYALHQASRAEAAAAEAQGQRDRAEAALADARGTQQALARVFAAGNPTLAGSPDVRFRDVLAATPAQIADLPPAIRLPVQYTVAVARAQIGDALAAIDGYAAAARIAEELGQPRARAQAEVRRIALALEHVDTSDSERAIAALLADPVVLDDPALHVAALIGGAEVANLQSRYETAISRFAAARQRWPEIAGHTLAIDDPGLVAELEIASLLLELEALAIGHPAARAPDDFLTAVRGAHARLAPTFAPDDPRLATLAILAEYLPDAMAGQAAWRERLLASIDAQVPRLGLGHPTILARLRTGIALTRLNQLADTTLLRRLVEAARVVDGSPRRRLRLVIGVSAGDIGPTRLGVTRAELLALREPVCGETAGPDLDCLLADFVIVQAEVGDGLTDAARARLGGLVARAAELPPSIRAQAYNQAGWQYKGLGSHDTAMDMAERALDAVAADTELSEQGRDVMLMRLSWSLRPARCDRVLALIGPIEPRLAGYPGIGGDVLARLLATCEVRAGRDPSVALARLAPWWEQAQEAGVDPAVRFEVINAHLEIFDVLGDDAEFARWARELAALEAAGVDTSVYPIERMPWIAKARQAATAGTRDARD